MEPRGPTPEAFFDGVVALRVDKGTGPGFGPGADRFLLGNARVLPVFSDSGRFSHSELNEVVTLSAA